MSKIINKFALHSGNVFTFRHQEGTVVDKLPVKMYTLKHHPIMGYHLAENLNALSVPSKIYGKAPARNQRIWNTYQNSTGVFTVGLFGAKGSGKSLQSALMAQTALNNGLPVIDVSEDFSTDSSCLDFLNSLGECFVIFDEFLKKIRSNLQENSDEDVSNSRLSNEQSKLLNFFQGSTNVKRIIYLIDNQKYGLSDFFTDRPGRMHYMFQFSSVEPEQITDLCAEKGINEAKKDTLLMYAKRTHVSFDSIRAIVDEWLQYPEESLQDLTTILNVPTLYSFTSQKYLVKSITEIQSKNSLLPFLENELIESDDSTLYFHFKISNPYLGKEFTKEEWKELKNKDNNNSRLQQAFLRNTDWDDWENQKNELTVNVSVSLGDSSLVKIQKGISYYNWDGIQFAVEPKETKIHSSYDYAILDV